MNKAKLEAILFASGEPIQIDIIKKTLNIDDFDIFFEEFCRDFDNRGIKPIKISDKIQLCTQSQYSELVQEVLKKSGKSKLSKSAIEVLTIAAYFQPITKIKIDKIRGIDSTYVVHTLCDRGFLEQCGRLDVIGKPVLYKTTDKFLRAFNLDSLSMLPPINDLEVNLEEKLGVLC